MYDVHLILTEEMADLLDKILRNAAHTYYRRKLKARANWEKERDGLYRPKKLERLSRTWDNAIFACIAIQEIQVRIWKARP